MEYRAVANRCAVCFDDLDLPISSIEAVAILSKKGFKVLDVDIIALARGCIGTSFYERGVNVRCAPTIVDCSSFTKWLYGERGIWLPRRSIQQREFGELVSLDNISTCDLIFTRGHKNYYLKDKNDEVGHVGIFTDMNTVIHAANKKSGVIEVPLDKFVGGKKIFRGARRYISKYKKIVTLQVPFQRTVEFSDDIKWIILQNLP